MFKWIAAFILSFVFPIVGIPWILYLLFKSKEEAQFQSFKREVNRTLGGEKPDDFSSKKEFEDFVNKQIDAFENDWRNGNFQKSKSKIDPQFVPSHGMEWTASSYTRKCKEVLREPIPEILEDFDENERTAKASLENHITMLNDLMEKAIKDVYQRLESGEKRTAILEDYQGQFAKPQKKVVKVSCERGKWRFSIYETIANIHYDKKILVYDKLREQPHLFHKTIDMKSFPKSLKE